MKAPAIDFSAATRQISESMNRAMSHMTETVQMDMSLLEKRRVEMMNEMELTQLNSFFQGRNEEATLETITQFEDRWADKMIEKNGRLSGRDLMEMRREKQMVEGVIQRNNSTLEKIGAAQEELRSPKGSMYDGEYAQESLQKYAETGELPSLDKPGVSPENPFLRVRPVDPESFLRNQRRPEELEQLREEVVTDGGLKFKTTTVYATDEDRATFIAEQLRTNPQFQLGVQEKYLDLKPEERQDIQQDAMAEGVNPLDYFALSYKDNLWRDRVRDAVDPTIARRQNFPTPSRAAVDETVRLTPNDRQELIFHDKPVEGYDLRPIGRKVSRTLTNVRNLDKNEIESPGGVEGILAGYLPGTDEVVIEATIPEYEKPITEGGEQVYRVVRKGTGRGPIQGTMEEIEAAIKRNKEIARESGESIEYTEPTPVTEAVRNAKVSYALPADKYSDLLERIDVPREQQKGSEKGSSGDKKSFSFEF